MLVYVFMFHPLSHKNWEKQQGLDWKLDYDRIAMPN